VSTRAGSRTIISGRVPARRETGPPGENVAIFASWGTAVRNDRPPGSRVVLSEITGPLRKTRSHQNTLEATGIPCFPITITGTCSYSGIGGIT
jgi:hypothetical protein